MPTTIDAECERAVLGSALLRTEHARRLVEELDSGDFTDRGRRTIYRALCEAVLSNDALEHPWTVCDNIDDETLQAAALTREGIRQMAGSGGELSAPFFESAVIKLRKLRRVRDLQGALAGLVAVDPLNTSADERVGIEANFRAATEAFDSIFAGENGGGTLREIAIGEAMSATEQEAIPWVVKGWLAERDIAIVAGDGGVGKSWLMLDLALALATGESWLDQHVVGGPYRVLYVDEENNSRLVRYRVRKWRLGCRREIRPDFDLRYLCDNGISLDDDNAYRRLCAIIDEMRPDWIILDSLVRFHSRDENSNSAMSSFFTERLRPLAARVGAGLVALHHMKKPQKDDEDSASVKNRMRGASDLGNQVDELYGLDKQIDDDFLVFSHEKTRWGKTHYALKLELTDVRRSGGTGTRWVYAGRADDSLSVIARCLGEAGEDGAFRTALVDAVKEDGAKAPSRATSRILRELFAAGEIAKLPIGRKTKYFLTASAPPHAVVSGSVD